MKIENRVSIPKELQVYPGDDKREWLYLGKLAGLHRFDTYEGEKRLRESTALTEEQMKHYFKEAL